MLIGYASFYKIWFTFEHFLDVIDWLEDDAIVVNLAKAFNVFDDLILDSKFMSDSETFL